MEYYIPLESEFGLFCACFGIYIYLMIHIIYFYCTSCAADLFEYDENKKLNLRQFFSHYKDQFPMLIVIIGGHYGETKFDCYDNYQVRHLKATDHNFVRKFYLKNSCKNLYLYSKERDL